MRAVASSGALDHEVTAGARAHRAAVDREGYSVARRVFEPEVLREVRAPLIEKLVADGSIQADFGDEDRFRWTGDAGTFERRQRDVIGDNVERLLFRTGAAGKAVEAAWGRTPALRNFNLFLMPPGDPTRVHRDGWWISDGGGPGEHFNLWVPLTRLGRGDGGLAVAVGSHRIADQPAPVPLKHPMHLDALANTGDYPDELLEPLWRTTRFELGDGLLFQPDIVHSTTANHGPYLRIALVLTGRDNNLPYGVQTILSLDAGRSLSETEWLTLAILAVQPAPPWLCWQAFGSRGIVGRLWACQPSDLIDRAFATLEARGLIKPHGTHDLGFVRDFQATLQGRDAVAEWLSTPSVRDDKLLAVKLVLCYWLELDPQRLLSEPHDSSVYRFL
jgi:ectoine hydroxylase-related dioxygenase (phytanoyl-CoA dioxygenase family)